MRLSLTAAALFLALGCSNPVDEIDEAVDCDNICDRYKDCYDSNYDDDACENRCRRIVDEEDSHAADACDACLDDRSCVEATFSCVSECARILP